MNKPKNTFQRPLLVAVALVAFATVAPDCDNIEGRNHEPGQDSAVAQVQQAPGTLLISES